MIKNKKTLADETHRTLDIGELHGSYLSENILPESLITDIDNAVSQTLASSSSVFFDAAIIDSILCALSTPRQEMRFQKKVVT